MSKLSTTQEFIEKANILENKYINVDGFDPETNTIYEFYGDYWHGNPNKYNLDKLNQTRQKTFSELNINTIKRENIIKNSGFNLITIWEMEWDKIDKYL